MYVKLSLENLNLDPCPHTPQAFILVKWPLHQRCAVVLYSWIINTIFVSKYYCFLIIVIINTNNKYLKNNICKCDTQFQLEKNGQIKKKYFKLNEYD